MDTDPVARVPAAGGPKDTPPEEASGDLTTLIPRAKYTHEEEDSDAAAQRRAKLVAVLLDLPKAFDIEERMSPIEISAVIDYTKWVILVGGLDELKFDERLLTNYLNNLVSSNIKYAVQENDSAKVVAPETYKLVARSLTSQLKHFTESNLQDSNVFTKLELLEMDLKLLRHGNLSHHHEVLQRVNRIFSIETVEFDPNTVGSRTSTAPEDSEESRHIDSSPPIDSSDADDHDESSVSKDSQPNILTQSTQINALKAADLSLESRVDVQATSSSNGTSQQSQKDQNITEEVQLSATSQNGSLVSTDSSVIAPRLKGILNRISDDAVKTDLIVWAKTSLSKLKSLEDLQSSSRDLESLVQKLLQVLEKPNNEIISKDQEIRSVETSLSKDKDLEDLGDSSGANGSDHDDITKVFIDYVEHRFSQFNEATKIVDERMSSLTEAELLLPSLKGSVLALKDKHTVVEGKIESLHKTLQEKYQGLAREILLHLEKNDIAAKENTSKIQEIADGHKVLETKVKDISGRDNDIKRFENAQLTIENTLRTLKSDYNDLKSTVEDELRMLLINEMKHSDAIFADMRKDFQSCLEKVNRQDHLSSSFQDKLRKMEIDYKRFDDTIKQMASNFVTRDKLNELRNVMLNLVRNLKLPIDQVTTRKDFDNFKLELNQYAKVENLGSIAHSLNSKFQELKNSLNVVHNVQQRTVNEINTQIKTSFDGLGMEVNGLHDKITHISKSNSGNNQAVQTLRDQVNKVNDKLNTIASAVDFNPRNEAVRNLETHLKDLNDKFATTSKNEHEAVKSLELRLNELDSKFLQNAKHGANQAEQYDPLNNQMNELTTDSDIKANLQVDLQQIQKSHTALQIRFEELESHIRSASKNKADLSSQNPIVIDDVGNDSLEELRSDLTAKISKIDTKLKKKVKYDNEFFNDKFGELVSTVKELETSVNEIKSKEVNNEPTHIKQEEDPRIELLMKEMSSMKRNQQILEAENKTLKERLTKIERFQVSPARNHPRSGSINAYSLARPSATSASANSTPPQPATSRQMNSMISTLLNRGKVASDLNISSSPGASPLPKKRPASESTSPRASSSSPDLRKIKLFRGDGGN